MTTGEVVTARQQICQFATIRAVGLGAPRDRTGPAERVPRRGREDEIRLDIITCKRKVPCAERNSYPSK